MALGADERVTKEAAEYLPSVEPAFGGGFDIRGADLMRLCGQTSEALSKSRQFLETKLEMEPMTLAFYESVAHRIIGDICLGTGEVEKALLEYEKCLKRTADDAFALGGKAQCLRKLGRENEAIETLKKAVALGYLEPGSLKDQSAQVLRSEPH